MAGPAAGYSSSLVDRKEADWAAVVRPAVEQGVLAEAVIRGRESGVVSEVDGKLAMY